jgi:F-type H+-transporting ATPase subunit delta
MKSALVSAEIAEPYAQALMAVAQSNNQVDRIADDVNDFLAAWSASADLRQGLTSPVIKPESKKNILRQLAGDQLHPYTLNFLLLLIDRGRSLFIPDVLNQFKVLVRQLRKTVLAEVTSAVELNEDQQNGIRDRVKGMVQAENVELNVSVDPDLIGGVVIKVGSQVIDASLRTQLRRIGMRLSAS